MISREVWSARYEQLRAGWFVHELTWGQGLFVRQGMAAWMKAWPAAEPSESATRPDSTTGLNRTRRRLLRWAASCNGNSHANSPI